MKPKKYNEFKVTLTIQRNGKFEITSKTPTARGHVSIHEHEAELNNRNVKRSHLWYELAEIEEPKNQRLAELKEQADELGIKYPKNISAENLEKKIETYKTE